MGKGKAMKKAKAKGGKMKAQVGAPKKAKIGAPKKSKMVSSGSDVDSFYSPPFSVIDEKAKGKAMKKAKAGFEKKAKAKGGKMKAHVGAPKKSKIISSGSDVDSFYSPPFSVIDEKAKGKATKKAKHAKAKGGKTKAQFGAPKKVKIGAPKKSKMV